MRGKIIIFFFSIFFFIYSGILYAKTFRVAIKEQASTYVYAALIKAVAEVTGNNVEIQVVPASRAEYLLVNNIVDIQIPQLLLQKNKDKLKFDFASISLFETAFVLYCNKNKPVDVVLLKSGKLKNPIIEIDPTLIDLFDIQFQPSNNPESSFRKVSINRIDGYIWSHFSGDAVLKKTGLKNIRRQFYNSFTVTMTIQKGKKGGDADMMIVRGINILKSNGRYIEIMGDLINKAQYNDWQP